MALTREQIVEQIRQKYFHCEACNREGCLNDYAYGSVLPEILREYDRLISENFGKLMGR